MQTVPKFVAALCSFVAISAAAQSLTFAEVLATGAKPHSVSEAKDLVSDAQTEFTLVNGSQRIWTNAADGAFVVSRSNGPVNQRSGRGAWSINEDAAYCLTFD